MSGRTWTLGVDLADLARVVEEARALLAEHGADERAQFLVALALEELVTNTVRHGLAGRDDGHVDVRLSVADGVVQLELEDDAPVFDPTEWPEPERPRSLEDSRIGGRGLLMVRRMIPEVRHRATGSGNALTLRFPLRHG